MLSTEGIILVTVLAVIVASLTWVILRDEGHQR